MPPSVADWLPEGHLAWFVLDVVAELDLSGFTGDYRADGRGGAVYDPSAMLAVLLYAYCTGERSSRRIERRLVEDVAFRVLAANQHPDHATLARFRRSIRMRSRRSSARCWACAWPAKCRHRPCASARQREGPCRGLIFHQRAALMAEPIGKRAPSRP